ncbi:MFS transporter [Candidatus Bipolaricaulota bacterium]|nr:MFS transporter [Candidatus Bipolaricaulota bacterium]
MRALAEGRLAGFVRRFDRGVWALVLIQLITSMGFSISLPYLSLYLHQQRGLSMTVVGAIMMASALVAAVGRRAGGELADRLGRRPVLLAAMGLRVVLFAGMALLLGLAGPVWTIAGAYLLVRLTGALAMPAVSAMVADLTPEGRRTEGYGLLRAGTNLGWGAGPAIGGYLAMVFPYAALFAFTALSSLVALGLVVAFVRESHHAQEVHSGLRDLAQTFRDSRFVAFVGLSLLVLVVGGQLVSTLSVFVVARLGYSEAAFGGLLTLNGLLVAALQYPIARWAERRPQLLGLVAGAFLYGAGYLLFGWLEAYLGLLVAIVVVTLGEMLFAPTTLSVVAALAPPARRGRYMGAFGLAESFGWSAGPFLGGVLLDLLPHSPAAMWGIITSLSFAAALGFIMWGRKKKTPPVRV